MDFVYSPEPRIMKETSIKAAVIQRHPRVPSKLHYLQYTVVQGFLTGFNTSSHPVRNSAGHFFSRQGWIHFMIFL